MCSSKFLYHVISFQPEEIPSVLLLRQVWYLWFLLALVYLKIPLFHLYSKKSIFTEYRILAWKSFHSLQHIIPLFSVIYCFWSKTIICKACPFSLLFLETFLTFFNNLTITYLYVIHLLFSFIEVQGSWICTLMFVNKFETF